MFHVGTQVLKDLRPYPTAALNVSSPCGHLWQARPQQPWGSQMFIKVGKKHPQKAAPKHFGSFDQPGGDSRGSTRVKQTWK